MSDSYKALVTGASSGIGAATAARLARDGFEVGLIGRRRDRLDALAANIVQGGSRRPRVYDLDVVNETACRLALEDLSSGGSGELHVLVNGAGAGTWGLAAEADPADWDVMIDVNLRALLKITQMALPHLTRGAAGPRGVADVVSISSVAGRKMPFPVGAVYAATKHGVGAFSEGLRLEMAPRHVRVGLVEPGIVETEMTTRGLPYAPDARNPKGLGFLSADDVAGAVAYMMGQPPRAAINEILLRHTEQLV